MDRSRWFAAVSALAFVALTGCSANSSPTAVTVTSGVGGSGSSASSASSAAPSDGTSSAATAEGAPATSTGTKSPTPKGSPLPPPFTSGTLYYGRITSFTTDGTQISIALCLYFNGPDVNQQAAKYGVKTPVPNDYFTVDEGKTVTLAVPASVKASLVQGGISNMMSRSEWAAGMLHEASQTTAGQAFKPLFVMTFQGQKLATLEQIFTP